MKKIYFMALLSCMTFAAFSQTTVTLFSTGAAGSYISGSAATFGGGTRADGNIGATTSYLGFSSEGYAVFDLSSLPAGATITSCVIGFYVNTYEAGTAGACNTYGYPGDLSTVTVEATLYSDMTSGAPLSTASYGAGVGNQTLASTVPSVSFIQGQIGNTISICWTGGGAAAYEITGETGATSTTGTGGAPYLQITYTCTGVSGVSASASPNPVCVGSTLTLTGAGTGTTSYSWAGPGGYTGAGEATALTTTASSAGVYTLTAYNASGCGTEATTASVALSATPVAAISGTPLTFCDGEDVVLSGTAGGGYTYQWYQSGSMITGATNQTYTDTVSGSFTVEIDNTTTGCANTSPATVVSVLPYDPPLSPSGNSGFCEGSYLTLGIDITGLVTTGITFQWDQNGIAIAGAVNSTYTTNSAGIYNCIMTTAACSDTTQSTHVTEYPLPFPTVSYNDGVLSTSNIYSAYQWFLNLVAIPGATSYSLTVPENGSYRVEVRDTSGCSTNSDAYPVYNLSVNNINKTVAKIYPNPANKVIYIASSYAVRAVITTIEGNKLIEKAGANDIDVSALPDGIYLIMLYNDAGERVLLDKLVKE